MNTLVSNIKVEDVPKPEARAFKAIGLVGEVESREVRNGYVQVTIPLAYRLAETDQSDRTFYARINIKPEWLQPGFTATTTNEQISYNINVRKLMRGLFTGAGITEGEMDFNVLQGRTVGFGTKTQKNDPSRLEVSYFFTPKV